MASKWILPILFLPTMAFATLSESRRVVGIVKSFDKQKVELISHEKVVAVDAATVAKKYPKLKAGMLIEIDLTPSEFSKVTSRELSK